MVFNKHVNECSILAKYVAFFFIQFTFSVNMLDVSPRTCKGKMVAYIADIYK